MELRQLQLQLTDLKFSGRKDEPEDWSPGHWAGYGQGSMGSYPMHVQWIGWIDECDVMWPLRLALTIAWSHGDSVTETLRFNWGKYYELPCLRGNGLVLRCFLWFEWRLFQCSLFDYTGYCVCVCWFFWVMMPPIHPLLKRRIHTVSNLPVRTSRCDHHVLLDSGWVATDEKNMRFFVSKSYVYIYIMFHHVSSGMPACWISEAWNNRCFRPGRSQLATPRPCGTMKIDPAWDSRCKKGVSSSNYSLEYAICV